MYLTNGEKDAKDMIKKQSNIIAFCHTNNTTYFKVVLPNALQNGDVISADIYRGDSGYGVWLSSSTPRPGSAPTAKIITAGSSKAWETGLTYTVATGDGICGETTFYVYRATGNSTYFTNLTITRTLTAPLFTEQPQDASYSTGETPEALTVAALASDGGSVTYQWYETDATKSTESSLDAGATYTPSTVAAGTKYYFCRATDTNGATDSEVAIITVSAAAAPTTVSITASPAASVAKNTAVTLTADADGTPAPTYEWFQCDDALKTNPVSKGTGATYSPVTTAAGTFYYYVKATNSEGNKESDVYTLTVTPSTACELTNIKFSNGAYGAIDATAKTITVPYLAGESEPTVEESSLVISDDATYALDGNTLTVTAEDGTTNKAFTITKTAFTPLAVAADIATTTFSDVPSWMFNPYGWDSSKGVKFAKNVDEASNMRIAKGFARQYYFIEAAKTLTLTSGSSGARNIKVYRNGVELATPTATAAKDKTIDIALDEDAPCMIMIESNQTGSGGDGGFTKYAVKARTAPIDITPAKEYTTLTSAYGLDFSGVAELTAYIVKDNDASDGVITMTQVDKVPANTGLVIKATTTGSAISVPVIYADYDDVAGNKMAGSATATTAIADNGGYILSNGKFHPAKAGDLPAGKAYLAISVSAPELVISFDDDNAEGNTTAIETVKNVAERGEFYNLNGQRVSQPTKGLYIVNGKKVIIK